MSASDALEAELVEAIWRAPDDPGPREVYADWLEESDPARARFLRAETRFAARPRHLEAWLRLAEARNGVDRAWLDRVALRFDLVLERVAPGCDGPVMDRINGCTSLGLRRSASLVRAPPAAFLEQLDGAEADAVRAYVEGRQEAYVTLRRRPGPRLGDAPPRGARSVVMDPPPDFLRGEAEPDGVARVLGVSQQRAAAMVFGFGPLATGLSQPEALILKRRLQSALPPEHRDSVRIQ